jgi:hypothetical protein
MLSYHNPDAERILEIPIYRCTDEQHRAQEKERFESWVEPLETGFYIGGRTPERVKIWEEYRADSYRRTVTLWDFNQIVAWLRLYAWSGNIRAYLFFVRESMAKIMRHKTFNTSRGNFIEMHVFPKQSNEEILAKLKKLILAQAAANSRLRRLYVDMGVLDVLGPHIDWIGLTKSRLP